LIQLEKREAQGKGGEEEGKRRGGMRGEREGRGKKGKVRWGEISPQRSFL